MRPFVVVNNLNYFTWITANWTAESEGIRLCIPAEMLFKKKKNDHRGKPWLKWLISYSILYGESNQINKSKNLWEQSREPTNSTHIWRRGPESNPGHIGGRRALSPPPALRDGPFDWYWTEPQWRLIRGNIIKMRWMSFAYDHSFSSIPKMRITPLPLPRPPSPHFTCICKTTDGKQFLSIITQYSKTVSVFKAKHN